MEKSALEHFRNTALGIGGPAVLGLLIAAETSAAHDLTQQPWWRWSLGVAVALLLSGAWGYAAPYFKGMRFRVPWDYPDSVNSKVHLEETETNKWRQIAPLLSTYRKTKDLAARLEILADEMDARKPSVTLDDMVAEFMKTSDINAKQFDEGFRQEVVRLAADLRSQYGLISTDLTDEILAAQVFGAVQVRRMIEGFHSLATALEKILIDQMFQLDDS